MSELMKGDFYQTFITLILFDAILLLLINLITRRKQQKIEAPAPAPPKQTLNLNQYVTSTQYGDDPVSVNKRQPYRTNITRKTRCYYPTKDGEQPYAEYKMNYFS